MSRVLQLITLNIIIIFAISTIALAQPPNPTNIHVSPDMIEDTIHVPKDTSANDFADNKKNADDHGCNDAWAIFNSGPSQLPSGVWASNIVNQLHITQHDGLDGYFRCSSYGCMTYLCTKDEWPANALSVKVKW